jgi:4-hydroxy-tetrahydrodipicolinate synthase
VSRAPARVITALVTPFDEHGRVDAGRAAELAALLAARGSDGILLAGTTGESPTLSMEEKLALCRAVRRRVDGRAQVWLGTGSNDTAESRALTRAAEDAGAEGVLLVVPYYNRPPQAGLRAHFVAVARETRLPVMVYNIPSRTGTNLLPATLAQVVAEAGNVVAIKEASRDLEQVAEIRRRLPPDFLIYSGDDQLTLPIVALGGAGVVSVASHLVPGRVAELVRVALEGDRERAIALQAELLPLFRALFVTTNPIPVKYALRLAGFPCGGFRPPLCEPSPEEAAAVAQALDALGLRGVYAGTG